MASLDTSTNDSIKTSKMSTNASLKTSKTTKTSTNASLKTSKTTKTSTNASLKTSKTTKTASLKIANVDSSTKNNNTPFKTKPNVDKNFEFAKYKPYDGNTIYAKEGDDDIGVSIYTKPRHDEMPKEFIKEIIEFVRVEVNPQMTEYKNMIERDIYSFSENLVNIDRRYGHHRIKVFNTNVSVGPALGKYSQLNGRAFKYQIQNVDESLTHNVYCDVNIKIMDESDVVLGEAVVGRISFGVPKMASNIENIDNLNPKQSLLMGLTSTLTNVFYKGGISYKINYEEGNMPNIIGCRKLNDSEYKLDIISSKTKSVGSSHLDISYNSKTSETVVGIFVSKFDVKVRLSTKTLYMLCGILDFQTALETVVCKNDSAYKIIADAFWQIWTTKNDTAVELTRRANTMDELYVAMKQQIYAKNPQKYNSMSPVQMLTILSTTLLSRVTEAENKSVSIKDLYIGRMFSVLINTSLGRYEATNRYAYVGKVVKTPTSQLMTALQVVFSKQIVNPIYRALNRLMNNDEEYSPDKLAQLKSSLLFLNKQHAAITSNIILRIRTGKTMEERKLADKQIQQQQLLVDGKPQTPATNDGSGVRDINSRNADVNSTPGMIQSDSTLYIKDTTSNKSVNDHSVNKRQPDKTGITGIDSTYTPDGSTDVGLRRELSAHSSIVIVDTDIQTVLDALRQIEDFNELKIRKHLIDPKIFQIMVDGLIYGYTHNGVKFRHDISIARQFGRFPSEVSAKLYYDRLYIEIITTKGRIKNIAYPINPIDGTLYLTNKDIEIGRASCRERV